MFRPLLPASVNGREASAFARCSKWFAGREWTTVKELSGFVGVSEKTLRSRHLPAMIREGRLIRRYPDRRRHRGQAYAVPPSSPLALDPLHQNHNEIKS